MDVVLVIGVMTFATFSIRSISISLFSGRELSSNLMRALSLVPVSILSAICAPLIFQPLGKWDNPLFLVEFWAAISCIFFTRLGMLPSIFVGLAVYVIGATLFS